MSATILYKNGIPVLSPEAIERIRATRRLSSLKAAETLRKRRGEFYSSTKLLARWAPKA